MKVITSALTLAAMMWLALAAPVADPAPAPAPVAEPEPGIICSGLVGPYGACSPRVIKKSEE